MKVANFILDKEYVGYYLHRYVCTMIMDIELVKVHQLTQNLHMRYANYLL